MLISNVPLKNSSLRIFCSGSWRSSWPKSKCERVIPKKSATFPASSTFGFRLFFFHSAIDDNGTPVPLDISFRVIRRLSIKCESVWAIFSFICYSIRPFTLSQWGIPTIQNPPWQNRSGFLSFHLAWWPHESGVNMPCLAFTFYFLFCQRFWLALPASAFWIDACSFASNGLRFSMVQL